jgi:DNA-binding SARP family transcriptional activator
VQRLAAVLGLGQRDELLAVPVAAPAGAGAGRQDGSGDRQAGGSGAGGLRLCVLGPLTAWRDGTLVPVRPPRLRAVLGLLAVHLGTGVHRDAFVDALWGDDPPASAVVIVQSQVSRLRRVLDPGRAGPPGGGIVSCDGMRYRLHHGVRCDAGEFAGLMSEAAAAAAAGDLAGACALYERALGLWRGDPLADVDVLRAHPAVAGLAWQRAAAVIGYAEAAVAAGWHDRVIEQLRELTASETLHEKAHALLMTALAGIGQQAAALALFEDLRRRLDAELGVAPGPVLAGAHLKVLRQAVPVIPASGNGAGHPAPADGGRPHQPAPRQLPAMPTAVWRCAGYSITTSARPVRRLSCSIPTATRSL